MLRSRVSRSAPFTMMMCLLLMFLPTASALAQADGKAVSVVDAISTVRFETGSGDPGAVRYLRDTSGADLWELEKRPQGKAAESSGSFRLHSSIPLSVTSTEAMRATLEARGVEQYERELVVGTVYQTNGQEQYVAALRFDIRVKDDEDIVRESAMVTLMTGSNLHDLEVVAGEFGRELSGRQAPKFSPISEGDSPASKSTCRHYCILEHETDVRLCTNIYRACITAAGAGVVGCLLACPATGPLVIPCIIACGVADAAIVALCFFNRTQCVRQAGRDKLTCIDRCPPLIP